MSGVLGIRHVLAEKQGNRCCYCNVFMLPRGTMISKRGKQTLHPKSQTIEHLRRKADGGNGHWDNKALACYDCNSGRGKIDWLTYKSLKTGELVA